MTRNLRTITKWVPLQDEEDKILFAECKHLKLSSEEVIEILGKLLSELQSKSGWKFHQVVSANEFIVEKLEDVSDMTQSLVDNFGSAFKKLTSHSVALVQIKVNLWKQILWKIKLKLTYFLQELISQIAFFFVYYGEKLLSLTFKISNIYNQSLGMDSKFQLSTSSNIVCGNTCPYLLYPMRKTSITKLLQILAQNRAELCCHKLIDCLLETYKIYDVSDDDNCSDNSSLEIYRAITRHMSPPEDNIDVSSEKIDLNESDSFTTIQELITYEEQNVIDLLNMAVQVAPSMLGSDSIKKSKSAGTTKINSKAKAKVLDYYQQILWGEVGIFLEHIILWWGAMPLASRPPYSSQHLREWITQFLPTINIPSFILSALTTLADALGLHVTSTSWDESFRLALVASKSMYSSNHGRLFSDLLQNLVSLSNQCELTSNWILGAPLDELPLVEQIPILHRLDHSIHTTRLWAINETKRLANNWNVDNFFKITHCDVINCVTQLSDLKLRDHINEIETTKMSPHVQVCANLRGKLVSEVTTNFQKLKDSPKQCVDTLACICRMISLANLQMIFPKNQHYSKHVYEVNKPSGYVDKYLDEILTPVLSATDDYHISNMVLKIMCESWLDHIYMNKVRFSGHGACQLLTDFGSVATWLVNCPILTPHIRKKMLKNEVLRRCEGVGRLLLRAPGEHLKMRDKKRNDNESPTSDNAELMPPEMYVPNQEQWLELRAGKKRIFNTSLCCHQMNF